MKRLFITSVFVLLAFVGFAQNEEARYNYYDTEIVRNADGSTDYRVKFSLTLYTHTAMNSTYGQTYVTYNPEHQRVVVNEAYTIQKKGKKVVMPERALTDVLPSWAAKASDFNHLKEKIIMHTGLDLGSTIYLDYTIHSDAGFNKNLDFNERYDATSPITKRSYTIKVPEAAKLQYMMCSPNGGVAPAKDNVEGGQHIVRYEIDNIPASSRDYYQVRNLTKQRNVFCTISTFEDEMKDLFYSGIDPDVKAWAEDYKKAEPNGKKRYDYIRKYVAEQFETVEVPLTATYSLRPMKKVRQGAYLTPYERAALLQQMLSACNIKADVRVDFEPTLPAQFRTLNNVRNFYVTERFGDNENTLNPSRTTGYISPSMQVGLDREIIKPDKGLEIAKNYDLDVTSTKFGDKPYYVLELPINREGVAGWNMAELPTKREVSFEVPRLVEECETYVVKVEKGVTLKGAYTTSVSDEKTGAAMAISRDKSNDGTVTVVRRISIPQKIFSVDEYEGVRKVIAAWMDRNSYRLLFTK